MKIPEDKSLPKSELTVTPHSDPTCQSKSTASNYAEVSNAITTQPVTEANLFRLSPPRYRPGSIELVQIWLDATTDPCSEETARGPQCSEECSWGPPPRDGPHDYLWDALAEFHRYMLVYRIHTELSLTRNPPRIGQRRNHLYDNNYTSASPGLDDIDAEAAISDTETVVRIPPADEILK
ncbi:hypothetical protein Q9L58_009043 [Maublancomyces gigas]|uniref:Uncharacterized protein n=1 Tax=Discina gigas TaxID=1032678 RepID=A0ABR3G802_9PEZI